MKNACNEIREFLSAANCGKRDWLTRPWGRVYVRSAHRIYNSQIVLPTLDIANIDVKEGWRGKGCFTRWLERAEEVCWKSGRVVFVETVQEERFRNFFLKRGYKPHPCAAWCFMNTPDWSAVYDLQSACFEGLGGIQALGQMNE